MGAHDGGGRMAIEENKALVRRFYEEVWARLPLGCHESFTWSFGPL
jgi:hypothetical protein